MRPMTAILTGSLLALVAGPAFADAIDGNWCHADGRRFTIRGPDIVTPGGKAMQGDYSRHFFSYSAPVAEQGAGSPIFMTLMGENTVHWRYGALPAASAETWVRCLPSISGLDRPARS